MPTTQNKGYQVQVTSSNVGTWGAVLNDQMIAVVDNNMGGIVTKSLSSSNVTLDATESQMAIVRLTGVLLANIQVTTSCVGFFFVENLTSGAFSVTVTNGVAGVVVPAGRSTLIADVTNGVRIASTDTFPTGTSMIFQQTSAPTGWTKQVTHNDKAVRIVSGSVGSGGSLGFTTAFSSTRTVVGTTDGTAITINQMPPHSHDTTLPMGTDTGAPGDKVLAGKNNGGTRVFTSTTVGLGQAHSHPFTSSSFNMSVQYLDFIIATKN